jgi:hypothetical protein
LNARTLRHRRQPIELFELRDPDPYRMKHLFAHIFWGDYPAGIKLAIVLYFIGMLNKRKALRVQSDGV